VEYNYNKMCIEFDEPHHNFKHDVEREIEKNKKIEGISIYRVKESEYLLNPVEVIEDLVQIIYYNNLSKKDKYKPYLS